MSLDHILYLVLSGGRGENSPVAIRSHARGGTRGEAEPGNSLLEGLTMPLRWSVIPLFLCAPAVAGQVPQIAPDPTVTIGATADDGRIVLERIVGVALLPTGIVIADGSANALVFFDRAGREVARAGRTGGGPGEFRRLSGVLTCGNRLFAHEFRTLSLSEFDAGGRFLGQLRLERPAMPMTPVICRPGAGFAGLTGFRPTATESMPGVRGARAEIALYNAEGAIETTLPIEQAGEVVMFGDGGTPRPLAPFLTLAAKGGGIVFGTGADSSVTLFGVGGGPTVAYLPLHRAETRPADRRAATQAVLDRVPNAMRERISAVLDGVQVPGTLPFYQRMLPGPSGTVWLLTSGPGADRQVWTVTDGMRLLGTVTLPIRGDLLVIGREQMAILVTDENGEQRMQLHRWTVPR